MEHLKEKQYYIDLYDKLTVEHCRRFEQLHMVGDDDIFDKTGKEYSKEEITRIRQATSEFHLYFVTGEEYKKKDETIRKWTERDRQKDLKIENAEEPQLVRCKTCASTMSCSSKDLWSCDDKVQFFFDCPNGCKPRRLLYEDGTERVFKPTLCPECSHEVKNTSEKLNEHIVTTTYTCPQCDHSYTDELDLTPKEEVEDPDFEKDRERFCLTDKKGMDYVTWSANLKAFGKSMDKQRERDEKKEIYEKVAELKKLTVPQLKEYLLTIFEKENYSNLIFEKPDMGRIVSIEFSIEEMETENERVSMQKLKKLLQNNLEETNWRLMSDGVSYRLGMMSGRIRIYEDQDDLAKLIEKKHGK